MRSALATSPGKWILIGEHFVVDGAPAVALPLPRAATVVTAHLRSGPGGVRVRSAVHDAGALRLVARLMGPRLATLDARLHLVVSSNLPVGAGLGSSAALVVAMASALRRLGLLSGRLSMSRLRQLEGVFHATPSGIDTTTVASEAPIRFRAIDDWQRLWLEEAPPALLVFADETRRTEQVQRALPIDVPMRRALHDDYLALAAAGQSSLSLRDWRSLGRVMNHNQSLLARLGVVTAPQLALIDRLRELGALGAKITGAGGGGAVVALHEDPAWLDRRLAADPLTTLQTRPDGHHEPASDP